MTEDERSITGHDERSITVMGLDPMAAYWLGLYVGFRARDVPLACFDWFGEHERAIAEAAALGVPVALWCKAQLIDHLAPEPPGGDAV